jgi:hypothetical protein
MDLTYFVFEGKINDATVVFARKQRSSQEELAGIRE